MCHLVPQQVLPKAKVNSVPLFDKMATIKVAKATLRREMKKILASLTKEEKCRQSEEVTRKVNIIIQTLKFQFDLQQSCVQDIKMNVLLTCSV